MVVTRSGTDTSLIKLPRNHPLFDIVDEALYYLNTLTTFDFGVRDLAVLAHNSSFIVDPEACGEKVWFPPHELMISHREVSMALANSYNPKDYMPIYRILTSNSIHSVSERHKKSKAFRELILKLVPSVIDVHITTE
jgi:hypothetical protein